jgi:hypothetical protein
MRWARQRWRNERGRHSSTARISPAQLPAAPALSCQPSPGTVLIREWHGVAYHVSVLDHGVRYGGEPYAAPSIVASPKIPV